MPVAPSVPTTIGDDEAGPRRSRLLLIALAVVATLSAVFAAVVIFSNSTAAKTSAEDPVALVRTGDHSLSIGATDAETKVVVYEDFGSADSRAFEIASRDFLRIEAAEGDTMVEYHPVTLAAPDYSADALAAWGVLVEQGRPKQALALHDLLFDLQPNPDDTAQQEFVALAKKAGVKDNRVLDAVRAPDPAFAASTEQEAHVAGVSTTPSVRVDGQALTGSSPVALADELQRLILKKSAAS